MEKYTEASLKKPSIVSLAEIIMRRVEEWATWVKRIKRYKLPVIKQTSHGDVMYSMGAKVAKKLTLKCSYHLKEKIATLYGDRW